MSHKSNGQPLRVALITRGLTMGGAQQHIVKLCHDVVRADVALSLFLLVQDEPQDLLSAMPPDIPVFISPFRRHHPRVLKWLADGLHGQRIQVAHSFLWTADAFASLSRTVFSRVPLICSERGDRSYSGYTRKRNLFDRIVTFGTAACVCANSDFGRRMLVRHGCPAAKLRVIRNGVRLDVIDASQPVGLRRMLGWPDTCRVIGTVSRLVPYKAVDTLIEAVGRLASDQRVYCAIVGDGPERPALERLVRRLDLADRVALLGMRSPSAPFVKDFDIATLTTRVNTEHCSNSILEYMACGKPVIATRVGGNPELVTDAESGLLVEPDDPEALAQALRQLIAQPAAAERMGQCGRARIEREFQMPIVAERFVELWRGVAAR